MTQPAGLASLNRGTGTVLYGRGHLGSIWGKKSRPNPFPFLLNLFYARNLPGPAQQGTASESHPALMKHKTLQVQFY